MNLKKIKLTNFRNYLNFEHSFSHAKTIITGQNAQGKSNVLEAINILATSQSDRAERDSNLIYWGKDYALIFASISGNHTDTEIALQINPTGRRKLKINGVDKRAPQADLLGNFFAVMFSCDDLYLIKGSPSGRRKWLDSVLFQLDKKYHKYLNDYQKSVSQKNSLLKRVHEISIPRNEVIKQLEIWNEQIINLGSEIISERYRFLEEINPVAKGFLKSISKETEELNLIYSSTTLQDIVPDTSEIKKLFRKSLDEKQHEEINRGLSLIGPHRDDIIFLINSKEAKLFASQGQQRSTILAIKLAELRTIENRNSEVPVLLLDDVFAELDESRQDFLLHNLPENIQTFLTTTHISDLQKEFLKGAEVLQISKGELVKEFEMAK